MTGQQLFQVWIVTYDDWQPQAWNEVPPVASALEPAEPALMAAREAAEFVRGFNQTMLRNPRNLWAVPVPIEVHHECRMVPGQIIAHDDLDFANANFDFN